VGRQAACKSESKALAEKDVSTNGSQLELSATVWNLVAVCDTGEQHCGERQNTGATHALHPFGPPSTKSPAFNA
jgi:hypothetical protein